MIDRLPDGPLHVRAHGFALDVPIVDRRAVPVELARIDIALDDLQFLAGQAHQPLDEVGFRLVRTFEDHHVPAPRLGNIVNVLVYQDAVAGVGW